MRATVDVEKVLELNRTFHDEVECRTYDQRMGVTYDDASVREMIGELEGVLGRPLPSGGTVVDVGAGTGNVSIKLALDGRFDRVVAVDISPGMLGEAQRRAADHRVAIETLVSDMRPMPLDDASVDLLVGCAVLHHLPDVEGFVAEVRRVLKPGAPFIFIGEPGTFGARATELLKLPVVVAGRLVNKVRGQRRKLWEHDHIDVHTFSPEDVQRLFGRGRFDRVRFAPAGFAEPIVDQGLLVVVQSLLGDLPGVSEACSAARGGLRQLDHRVLERALPSGALASVKVSGFCPDADPSERRAA